MTQYLLTPSVTPLPQNLNIFTMVDGESTYSDVTTAGYLNPQVTLGHTFTENDLILIKFDTTADFFEIAIDDDGVITLTGLSSPSGPNVIAGSNGEAGYLESYSGTEDKGYLRLYATANTGDTATSITNAAFGQATVLTIPDPGTSTAKFLLDNNAGTQHILTGSLQVDAGNVIAGISGTAGSLRSFPATTARGYLKIQGAASAADYVTTLTNSSMSQATTLTFPDPGGGAAHVPLCVVNLDLTPVGAYFTTQVFATSASLASAGHVVIQDGFGTARFAVRDVKMVYSASGLSGGGGNRLLKITDGTNDFNASGITAALLGTPVNTVWGGSGNPLPSTLDINTYSVAGNDIYLVYSGGTTDFASGQISVLVTLERVV